MITEVLRLSEELIKNQSALIEILKTELEGKDKVIRIQEEQLALADKVNKLLTQANAILGGTLL